MKKENEESLSEKIWREKADNPFVLTKDIKEKIQEFLSELKEGCGKEGCGVPVRDGYGDENVDISPCGCMCPHHKRIEYCEDCQKWIEKINKLALKKFGEGILE